jgi:16S rRNA (cytosine967-C5)-methyltransferase
MLLHTIAEPPTIVHGARVDSLPADLAVPHGQPGFACWQGDHAQLINFLDAARDRWVQDVTASLPVAATADMRPKLAIDYCAGRGTKARQLAALHSKSRIVAADIDVVRHAELQSSLIRYANVEVVPFETMRRFEGQCDLLLLDVPCSNTGVLSRRLEARYRYSQSMFERMTGIQRKIIDAAAPLLGRSATIIYSTCSIEACENAEQARWIAGRLNMTIRKEQLTLPGGKGPTYRDGGYFAVLSRDGAGGTGT